MSSSAMEEVLQKGVMGFIRVLHPFFSGGTVLFLCYMELNTQVLVLEGVEGEDGWAGRNK